MPPALSLPDAAARAFGDDAEAAEARLRLLAAVKAYELRQLTAGAAAELAGLSKFGFLRRLGEFGVSAIDTTADDLEREVAVARRARLADR